MPTSLLSRWCVPIFSSMMLQCHGADSVVLDPIDGAGAITPVAALSAPCAAHTAMFLGDGRVLVLGGFTNDENAAASVEAYHPVYVRPFADAAAN